MTRRLTLPPDVDRALAERAAFAGVTVPALIRAVLAAYVDAPIPPRVVSDAEAEAVRARLPPGVALLRVTRHVARGVPPAAEYRLHPPVALPGVRAAADGTLLGDAP